MFVRRLIGDLALAALIAVPAVLPGPHAPRSQTLDPARQTAVLAEAGMPTLTRADGAADRGHA